MKWKDIYKGAVVYHCVYTHWGKGIVQDVVVANLFEYLFEKGNRRVLVKFVAHDTVTRIQSNSLRKTPNRKKIRKMVALYRKRDVAAEDGGDRLILPL